MTATGAFKELEARLGYRFADAALLEQALTHASLSSPTRPHNQRFEFLGDRVLGLVIAEALLAADARASEGKLAPRLNALVRKETCAEIAAEIGLGDALLMGRSEMATGGRKKLALLGDAMEAVIAAVYLDGGFETARELVLRLWAKRISVAEENARDPKSALQEWAQGRGFPTPEYVEISRSGTDHAPMFCIEVSVQSGQKARAEAASKKLAQQLAASELLDRLEGANG